MNSFDIQDFNLSPYVDSIYYADLFIINGKVWMITGFGKSAAALIAINKSNKNILGTDFCALIRRENKLCGRYDNGIMSKNPNNVQKELLIEHEINIIAHCCFLQLKNPHFCNLIFPIQVGNFISLN